MILVVSLIGGIMLCSTINEALSHGPEARGAQVALLLLSGAFWGLGAMAGAW